MQWKPQQLTWPWGNQMCTLECGGVERYLVVYPKIFIYIYLWTRGHKHRSPSTAALVCEPLVIADTVRQHPQNLTGLLHSFARREAMTNIVTVSSTSHIWLRLRGLQNPASSSVSTVTLPTPFSSWSPARITQRTPKVVIYLSDGISGKHYE